MPSSPSTANIKCTFVEQKYFLLVIGVFKNTFENSKCRQYIDTMNKAKYGVAKSIAGQKNRDDCETCILGF